MCPRLLCSRSPPQYLHDLPGQVQDAARCPAQVTAQPFREGITDHSSTCHHPTILQPSPLPPLLPLPSLQLPLLLVEAQPDQTLFLSGVTANMKPAKASQPHSITPYSLALQAPVQHHVPAPAVKPPHPFPYQWLHFCLLVIFLLVSLSHVCAECFGKHTACS